MTHPPLPRMPRRAVLAAGLGLLAAPALLGRAHAQGVGEGALAQWFQWTQIIGPTWGNRSAITIRSYPRQDYATMLVWAAFPQRSIKLTTIADPDGALGQRMFRLYNERQPDDLARTIEIVEDFCWLGNDRLAEKVWTQPFPEAQRAWEAFLAAPSVEVPLPNEGTMVWMQPTRDSLEATKGSTLDMNGTLSTHPLTTIVTSMVSNSLFVAGSAQYRQALLNGTGLNDMENSILVRLPETLRPPYPHAYIRLLPFGRSTRRGA